MKLIMQTPLSYEEAKEIYTTARITQLRDLIQVEVDCTLEEAVALIELDKSEGDKSIYLKRG